MGITVNSPRIWRRAKCDDIISADTCEGSGFIIIGVAVCMWTCALEHLRIRQRLAGIGRDVRAAATVLLLPKSQAREHLLHRSSSPGDLTDMRHLDQTRIPLLYNWHPTLPGVPPASARCTRRRG
ncbi:hypothetical protein Adt_17862 [Abeliophyllum distichum]|uniref:Uncharacterized protein n=1 Tax=Abeliophyllum distichum TaxID=126358 RepID=A0ABD1THP4_9LAMI